MTRPQLSPVERRRYERNILLYYGFSFAGNLALWSPIWVLYLQHERGLSLTQITALDAPFWTIAILAEIPTGTVADRWGRKASLLLGAITFSLALFFFGIGENYWVLLLSYLAWPVSAALLSGADSAFVYDSLAMLGRESEFRKIIGRSNAIHSVGFMVGALLGAPLAAATNLMVPILVSAAIALLGVAAAMAFHEPRHQDDQPPLPYLQTMRTALRFSLEHPPLRWMLAVRAMLLAGPLVAIIFTQPFLASFDVPVGQFGLITTPRSLLAIGASLVAYRLATRLGERNLLYALGMASVSALLVLGVWDSLGAFSMFIVLAMCNAITMTITADYINRHSPQRLRATVLSVGQMAFSLALLVAEPSLGFIADRASLQTAFLVAGLAAAALIAVVLAGWTAAVRTSSVPTRVAREGALPPGEGRQPGPLA
jgi:MFS family permease